MEIDPRNDAALVADTLSGDREAFGQLYDSYAQIVRAVVLGVSGDWRGAEDMVQECFMRAFQKLATLREKERFGAWVTGIARQVGRERRRSLGRDRHEYVEPQSLPISVTDGTEGVQTRDEFEQVMRRLGELEEPERVAIHAYFLEGRAPLESAALLGMSRSGYYALVKRAIARLATAPQACDLRQK